MVDDAQYITFASTGDDLAVSGGMLPDPGPRPVDPGPLGSGGGPTHRGMFDNRIALNNSTPGFHGWHLEVTPERMEELRGSAGTTYTFTQGDIIDLHMIAGTGSEWSSDDARLNIFAITKGRPAGLSMLPIRDEQGVQLKDTDARFAIGNTVRLKFNVNVGWSITTEGGTTVTQTDIDKYQADLAAYNKLLAPVDPGPLGSGATTPAALGTFYLMPHHSTWAFKISAEGDRALLDRWSALPAPDGTNSSPGADNVPIAPTSFVPGTEDQYVLDVVVGSLEQMGPARTVQLGQWLVIGPEAFGAGSFSNATLRGIDGNNLPSTELKEGMVLRLRATGRQGMQVVAVNPTTGVTQADIDKYQADLAFYLASGARSMVLRTNVEGLADRLQQSLRLRQGSCIYDLDAGFPWDRLNGTDNAVLVEALLRRHINALAFVESIESIAITLDEVHRRLACKAVVRTTLGESVPVVFNTLT